MQYCTKCKNICEDLLTTCPTCKRATRLRAVKPNDLVYLLQTSEYESEELDGLFCDNGVKFEIHPHKVGIMTSVYDSSYMPSDKVIFVCYEDLPVAKKLLDDLQKEDEINDDEIPTPSKQVLFKQALITIAFLSAIMGLVLLVTFLTEFI